MSDLNIKFHPVDFSGVEAGLKEMGNAVSAAARAVSERKSKDKMRQALLKVVLCVFVAGLALLNWWALYSAFIAPTMPTISRVYLIGVASGSLGGAVIGWMIREITDGRLNESRNP